ncbi:MAG: CHRD domain-containing protein [Deltaproteobacteria bacterium]|nr:CHRD domain-containing protein [Deltaproteobacteria bacterium]
MRRVWAVGLVVLWGGGCDSTSSSRDAGLTSDGAVIDGATSRDGAGGGDGATVRDGTPPSDGAGGRDGGVKADGAARRDGASGTDGATTTPLVWQVRLSGSQEVPPSGAAGVVTAKITLGADRKSLEVEFTGVSGVTGFTAAHLHVGAAGENGAVIFDLASGSLATGLKKSLVAADLKPQPNAGINTFADVVTALLEGRLYINVHTTAKPGGALRAQVGKLNFTVELSGGQEVPPVTTTASGSATVTVSDDGSQLEVSLSVTGLGTITGAHLHVGGLGVSGPVLVTISSGTFTSPVKKAFKQGDLQGEYTMPQVIDALLTGRIYVNVHTQTNTGGEIRGQCGPLNLAATLTGAEEVPPVTSSGLGSAALFVPSDHSRIEVTLTASGLSNITAAHIHAGAKGTSGGVLFPLALASFASPLTKTLKAADLSGGGTFAEALRAIVEGKTYVNVHTQANPGGELRGQLTPASPAP